MRKSEKVFSTSECTAYEKEFVAVTAPGYGPYLIVMIAALTCEQFHGVQRIFAHTNCRINMGDLVNKFGSYVLLVEVCFAF